MANQNGTSSGEEQKLYQSKQPVAYKLKHAAQFAIITALLGYLAILIIPTNIQPSISPSPMTFSIITGVMAFILAFSQIYP